MPDIFRILIPVLVTCLCVTGCSEQSDRVLVSGYVTVDGQPLTKGSIRFIPASGRPVSSSIKSDGSFRLRENSLSVSVVDQGILPGVYQVAVTSQEVIDEAAGTVRWLAPAKYTDFRTSGIEMTIDRPEQDLEIALTWVGSEPLEEDGSVENENAAEEEAQNDQEETPAQ